jgi:hypothetical protein
MSIGLPISKSDVDMMIGGCCRDLNFVLDRIEALKAWLDSVVDAELEAMGYQPGEVAVLRSAFADVDQLRAIYQGQAALAEAKDFRAFAKRLFGFGF